MTRVNMSTQDELLHVDPPIEVEVNRLEGWCAEAFNLTVRRCQDAFCRRRPAKVCEDINTLWLHDYIYSSFPFWKNPESVNMQILSISKAHILDRTCLLFHWKVPASVYRHRLNLKPKASAGQVRYRKLGFAIRGIRRNNDPDRDCVRFARTAVCGWSGRRSKRRDGRGNEQNTDKTPS